MKPVSPREFEASSARQLPIPEFVAPGILCLPLPFPSGHVPYTLSYLVRDSDGGVHIIDPGWNSDENFALVEKALHSTGAGLADVRSMIVTHLHPDHLGMAPRLRAATKAPVILHRREQQAVETMATAPRLTASQSDEHYRGWGVPDARLPELAVVTNRGGAFVGFTADTLIDDDAELDIPGFGVTAIRTPGHTPGHLCLHVENEKLLFTGDHILPTVYSGLGLGGPTIENPIGAYLDSLRALEPFDDHTVCPGHGYRFTGLGERRAKILQHHGRRADEVRAAVSAHPDASIWQVASLVTWSAGFDNLASLTLYSALAQTAMYIDFVAPRP